MSWARLSGVPLKWAMSCRSSSSSDRIGAAGEGSSSPAGGIALRGEEFMLGSVGNSWALALWVLSRGVLIPSMVAALFPVGALSGAVMPGVSH